MRVAILGAGFMGSTHAAAWRETPAELVGIVAETEDQAAPLAQQVGARIFPNLAEVLPLVDVVDVCTPTHLHASMVLQAAAAGKHVICEKPLGRTLDEARDMILACKAAGVRLLVAHVVRFFPEYARAREVAQSGEIGTLGTLRLHRGSYRPKKAAGNWFLDEDKSGGILLDLMIHDFDYARWVAGEVTQVFARKISANHPTAPVDYALAILTHRSGAISHIAGGWAYPPPAFRTHFEINGSRGSIQHNSDASAPLLDLIARPPSNSPDVGLPASPVAESPYTAQIKEFYAALADDRPVRVTAEDGLAAVQIALAAVESVQTGRAISLQPLDEVLS